MVCKALHSVALSRFSFNYSLPGRLDSFPLPFVSALLAWVVGLFPTARTLSLAFLLDLQVSLTFLFLNSQFMTCLPFGCKNVLSVYLAVSLQVA